MKSVAIQLSHTMKLLRLSGQWKGEVYFLRSGWGGAGGAEGIVDTKHDGVGSGVSKVM